MATYKIDDLLNTTTGMTTIKSSQQIKNGKVLVQSIDWFTYAGKNVSLYVSSDGYVNFSYFNDTTKQLMVLYTNGTLTDLYKQEGQLESGRRFLKVRAKGYITTTSTDSAYGLTYELFLIEGQILFLNVVQIPTKRDSSAPSSLITDGTNKTSLNISVGATAPIRITVENAGVNQQISYKKYTDSLMTFDIASLLNKTTWMTQVSYPAITGVDWFTYDGTTVSTIYANNGSQIGFGQSAAHLKICDRDTGKIISAYRQEGYLNDGKKFLKIRITATTYSYYSSNSSYRAVYEIFLIENQTIFINIVQIPTQVSYMGTSSITDGTNTVNLDTAYGSTLPIQIVVENAGTDQEISYEMYPAKQYTGISISTLPNKTVYYLGDTFNKTGIVVTGTTSDGETVEITKGYTLSGFDSENVGNKTITVTFKKFTATFDVEVREDVITEISNVYYTKDYLIGWEFSSFSISIKWESGKTEQLRSGNTEGIGVSGFDSTTAGQKTVVISYSGVSKEISVVIHTSATLDVIDPKTEYYMNESSFEEPQVRVTYDDGTTEDSYSAEFTGFDSSKAGQCEITATYRSLTTTYTVNILDTITANIGSETDTDIVASLNLVTNVLTLTGTGDTKEIYAPSWGSGGILDDGGEYGNRAESIIVSEGITGLIGECFYSMQSVTEVSLPSTLKTIGRNCFYYCTAITELTLPENLESIESYAFSECKNMVLTVLSRTVSISEENTSYAGTLDVKMIKGYLGSTAETYAEQFNITFQMLDKITNLEVTSYPSRNYHIGESINKSDIVVTITMEDGTQQTTDAYDIAYDFSGIGTKTVTVSMGGLTDSFEVNVVAYSFTELIGNSDGMEVIRNTKNDDDTDTIDGASWFLFNGIAADKLYISGNNWIGFGASSEQLKICRRDGAVWYVYRLETTLDNGVKIMKIRVEGYTYYGASGDHESALKYELFMFDNGDMYLNVIQSPVSSSSYAGTSSITSNGKTTALSLNGATADSNINVSFLHQDDSGIDWEVNYKKYSFRTVTGILVTPPEKTKYYIGDQFDDAGMAVFIAYSDGGTEEITDYTISGFDSDAPGAKTICITYDGFTQEFQIEVIGETGIEIESLPEKKIYITGENLDISGLRINLLYDDGYRKEITGYTVSDLDTSTIGTKTLTIDYKGMTAEFSVEVHTVIGIRISRYPSKRYYRIGETLNTSDMYVNAILDNSRERPITGYTVSELESSTIGIKTVKVSYEATVDENTTAVYFDEFSVIVTSDGENPFEDSSNPISVSIHWINGEFEDLANEDIASGSVTLQESICSDRYFIWGGCICNQLTFTTHSKQFLSTEESAYPHGDIEAYVECNGTKVKIFTGTIDSGDREGILTRRKIIAYDYLYKFRNTDIAWWYKNKTTDKQMIMTQKQFRDDLFDYLGIEQVETTLEYDDALVPDTMNANEMNAVNIIKDMCLQNSVFGWMNRDGKFEYRTVKANCRMKGTDTKGNPLYEYFEAQVHFDTYKSCNFKEGRIWYPKEFLTDPYPGVFSPGGLTAQEAYENNVYYNRNSFFVGNQDWLDRAFQADEYGVYTVSEPIMPICFGITTKWDNQHLYRAQQYNAVVRGNPLNMVGDTIEIMVNKITEDGTELQWFVRSYIMSRTLKIIGDTSITDTYSANNAPYNSNNGQIGKDTPELSATLFRTRQEAPIISYRSFSDGTVALSDDGTVKKDKLRVGMSISRADYDALVAAGNTRTDTLYFVYEE